MALTAEEQRELEQLEYESLLAEQAAAQGAGAQQAAPPPEQDVSSMEAALQGFGQGGTLGYLPEMQARVNQGLSFVLPQSMGGAKGFNTGDESYEQLKAYFQGRDTKLKEGAPIASALGNVAGAVATLPVGGGAAKGASLGMKALRSAGTGAAYGGLANTEGEGLALKERLQNAAMGGALGAVGEGVVGSGGKLLKTVGDKMQKRSVLKQIGANTTQVKKVLEKDELPKIEGFLKEKGLMKAGRELEDVVEVSQKTLAEEGEKIGQLYTQAQDDAAMAMQAMGANTSGVRINGEELAGKIMTDMKNKYKNHPDRNQVLKNMEEATAVLRDMGDNVNIKDIHEFRMGLDENINWAKSAKERDAIQRAYIDARNAVADESKRVLDQLDKIVPGDRLKALKELNSKFSAAATVNKIANQGLARETAKAFLGQGIIGGGAGAGAGYLEYQRSGNPFSALGVGLGTTAGVGAMRRYGLPVGYQMGRGSQALGRGLEAVSRRPGEIATGLTSPWVNMRRENQ